MLKLGLKKKKKGKKSKKDQELFTEEELKQYKREHQAQPEAEEKQEATASVAAAAASGGENDDEWRKFAALTTGIDSILKKTQGDLDRIKSTSFFQRVQLPSEKKVEQEKKAAEEALEESKRAAEEALKKEAEERDPAKQLLNAVVELSDSEEDSDVDDSAFDTTFIDKVETGELPLAYVPEEEDEEPDLGPDPFDTGYAEKVIKGPEVSKKGKKLVNIGAAVEVLTGKVEAPVSAAKSRRQRRGIQNLLLESFEAELDEEAAGGGVEVLAPKTLLDEPPELAEDIPIDLSVSLHLTLQKQLKKEENEGENKEDDTVLEEIDVIKKDDDEFAQLASESLHIQAGVVNQSELKAAELAATTDWSEFELERVDKPSRPPPPRPLPPQKQGSDDDFDLGDDVDPFDTAYVEKIVPKSIEYDEDFDPRAGLDDEDDDFDPRAEEVNLFDSEGKPVKESLSVTKNDLLSASHSDLASIAPTLAPAEAEEPEEIDPFDTSAVDSLVAPGKTELKFLEKELLDSEKKAASLSDDDFDPRAEEEPKPSSESLRIRKSSLSLQIPGRGVSFAAPDLLKVDHETSSKIQKPLTPYYHRESSLSLEEEAVEEDPFDTSFVPEIVPSSIELDLLEKEILPTLKPSLSDDDFDPRALTPVAAVEKEKDSQKADIFLSVDNHNIKVLTPGIESSPEEIEVDPFDTSIANNIVPGKIELQLLEDELIEKKPVVPPSADILSDTQDNSIYVKILTPQPTGSLDLDSNQEDFDPFDTSFAANLAPGETEIKLIENEFIN